MNFAEFVKTLDFSNPTWDLFILIFFVAVAIFYGLSLGRDRILVILVSIYMALAVIANAPFLEKFTTSITINEAFAFKVTAFVGMFLVTFFLLSRSGLMKTLGASGARGSWWQVILFSFLHVGLLISVTLSFLPGEVAARLAPITKTIFVSEGGRFVWIVAPILVMALVREEKKSG
ncbi:hypothetical protein HY478_02825 [Candidatus Uhrbacteria bacterium]|nr:hypothetical protein [Candidatus Uhrbacteria bacterium]